MIGLHIRSTVGFLDVFSLRARLLPLTVAGFLVSGLEAQSARGVLPSTKEVRLERTIGTAGNGIGRIGDVAVSRQGDVFVLDLADFVIRVYGIDGTERTTMGRRGQGPGEFTRPARLLVSDSTVEVTDASSWLQIRFTHSGRHLDSRSAPAYGTRVTQLRDRLRVEEISTTTAIDPAAPAGAVRPAALTKLVLHLPQGRSDTIATFRSDLGRFESAPGQFTLRPTGFGTAATWAASGDSMIVVADGYTGTVRWQSVTSRGVALRRQESMGLTARVVSQADITNQERYLSTTTINIGSASSPIKPVNRLSDTPPRWSVATQSMVSPADGAVWVGAPRMLIRQRSSNTRELEVLDNRWTVFPPTGSAYRIELPSSVRLVAVFGDRILCVPTSQDEEPSVQVYRVVK